MEETEDDTKVSGFRDHFVKRSNQIPKLDKLVKVPEKISQYLPFIITSNLCSFLFYSRFYNGSLLDSEPEQLCQALLKQLLAKESESRIEAAIESAFFDHLRHLSQSQDAEIIK